MNISEQLIEELQAWVERPEGQRLENFLSERVGAEESEAILHAVDHGRRLYSELREAREEGVSREAWLANALKPHLTTDEESGDVSLTLAEGVTLIKDTPVALARSLKDQLVSAVWCAELDVDPTDALTDQLSSPLLEPLGEAIEAAAERAPAPVKALLSHYFESPLNDETERDVVSVVSSAVHRGSARLEPSARPEIETLGSVVDYGMFGAKVAAKVGGGAFSPEDAVELIEDRAAAHIARGVRRFVDKSLVAGGATLGGFLGGLIGQAPLGAKIGAVAGKVAGKLVSPLIEKGAKVVVKAARKVVSSVVKGVKSAVSSVVSSVASWFGW
jgi:hypothetical protein